MGLTTSYLNQIKNTKDMFDAIKQAQAPDKFTIKFLEDLGFTSTNDRGFVNMLKALGFLDDSGIPVQRYFEYLDDKNSQYVLAEGIKEAYEDLFRINKKAFEMKSDEIKGKLKTLLQGSKGEQVLGKMTSTFLTLCSLANFSKDNLHKVEFSDTSEIKINDSKIKEQLNEIKDENVFNNKPDFNLKYSINIELPATRDKSIYDAIFKSIKENLL